MRQLLKFISPKSTFGQPMTEKGEPCAGKVAVYDSSSVPPKVTEVRADDPLKMVEVLVSQTHRIIEERGGAIPRAAMKEIFENLIHASFKEVVVSVMNGGNVIRVADHGPGIKDKKRAFEPGFSTATPEMKKMIRGVGSGLAIVKETMNLAGGKISIENNLRRGSVVTLSLPAKSDRPETKELTPLHLSKRQKTVLSLIMEMGTVGPASLAQELEFSISSAYRDLAFLEKMGLVKTNSGGKRSLTQEGIEFLDLVLTS